MSGYISEFKYFGDSSQEFVEIALPEGTDPSGYTIALYMPNGQQYATFPLGSPTGTMSDHDVYVVDSSTPGFTTSNNIGNFFTDDAIALIDDNGDVVQFLSWEGHTVTATDGPAAGETSTNTGNISAVGQSMQSNDGGKTYFVQSNNNKGTIPACYAPGTSIATPLGSIKIEDLRAGDQVLCANGRASTIRWVWSGEQPLEEAALHEKPVLISKEALGIGRPARDLIVSGQHRIVVGQHGQLESQFSTPSMVPAKALTTLPGIRFMAGKKSMVWYHVLCAKHLLIRVDGIISETLLLGPEILQGLSNSQRGTLTAAIGLADIAKAPPPPALPCLSVDQTRRILKESRKIDTKAKMPRAHKPPLVIDHPPANQSLVAHPWSFAATRKTFHDWGKVAHKSLFTSGHTLC